MLFRSISDAEHVVSLVLGCLCRRRVYSDATQNSEEVLRLMRENLYRVIVVDLSLFGTSGMELITQLKQVSPLSQVVVLAENATPELVIECVERGAADFFSKMGDLSLLGSTVVESLGRANRWLKQLAFQSNCRKAATCGVEA